MQGQSLEEGRFVGISKNWCHCPCAPWNVDLEAADPPSYADDGLLYRTVCHNTNSTVRQDDLNKLQEWETCGSWSSTHRNLSPCIINKNKPIKTVYSLHHRQMDINYNLRLTTCISTRVYSTVHSKTTTTACSYSQTGVDKNSTRSLFVCLIGV